MQQMMDLMHNTEVHLKTQGECQQQHLIELKELRAESEHQRKVLAKIQGDVMQLNEKMSHHESALQAIPNQINETSKQTVHFINGNFIFSNN